jgi:drug/metabolite transporter (DMT)-like permease
MTSRLSTVPRKAWQGRSLVAAAAVLYGTVTLGGGLFHRLGFSLYEIALYPLVLTHLLLLVPALLRPRRAADPGFGIPRKMLPFFAVYGLIGALAELLQFGSIVLGVPIATAALLLYLQPIWTSLLGRVLLREEITLRKAAAIACAVAGAGVLLQSDQLAGADPRGLAAAVLGELRLGIDSFIHNISPVLTGARRSTCASPRKKATSRPGSKPWQRSPASGGMPLK